MTRAGLSELMFVCSFGTVLPLQVAGVSEVLGGCLDEGLGRPCRTDEREKSKNWGLNVNSRWSMSQFRAGVR